MSEHTISKDCRNLYAAGCWILTDNSTVHIRPKVVRVPIENTKAIQRSKSLVEQAIRVDCAL